ncbi:MAG: chlorophyllase/cutinase-like alpha/beta fold protein [Polyangiaceae bacterium]
MKRFSGIAVLTLGLALTACSSTKTSATGDAGQTLSFEACIARIQPNCSVTADKIDSACASLTMIPIPLTDGGSYGPVTIDAGPYGGKLDWNQGAKTPYVNPVNGSEPICLPVGVDTFMEPASVSAQVLNLRGLDHSLYTIFRPACMKDGETYPVITWANGTCGETQGYAPLLSTVASHGYVIIASNSTWTATAPTDKVQLRALDYAKYLNEDSSSVLYQRLNLDEIGAMGHSQGAQATATASSDPRIKAVMFFSGGTSNHQPFVYISADRDIGGTTPGSLADASAAATQPGAWLYYHQVLETGGTSTGHLVLMEQPERVLDMTIAWWDYQLKGDQTAKKMFVGDGCGLCNQPTEFEYGTNALLK